MVGLDYVFGVVCLFVVGCFFFVCVWFFFFFLHKKSGLVS